MKGRGRDQPLSEGRKAMKATKRELAATGVNIGQYYTQSADPPPLWPKPRKDCPNYIVPLNIKQRINLAQEINKEKKRHTYFVLLNPKRWNPEDSFQPKDIISQLGEHLYKTQRSLFPDELDTNINPLRLPIKRKDRRIESSSSLLAKHIEETLMSGTGRSKRLTSNIGSGLLGKEGSIEQISRKSSELIGSSQLLIGKDDIRGRGISREYSILSDEAAPRVVDNIENLDFYELLHGGGDPPSSDHDFTYHEEGERDDVDAYGEEDEENRHYAD